MTTENNIEKPQLRLTLFTDYICPFCYIGDLRLRRLWQHYEVLVNFRFIEIHPDTPEQGASVDTLNYSDEKWQGMMDGLMQMADEEGVKLAPSRRLANSHCALLLAEAVKKEGREVFYKLNSRLYEEYFVAGKNIGDIDVLKAIAKASGVSEETVNCTWADPEVENTLKMNMQMAVKAGVTGTPTFFIGQQRLTGAVSFEKMFQAAESAVNERTKTNE